MFNQRKIAIQGFEGCFHQSAAIQFFGNDISLVTCNNFRSLIKNAHEPSQTDAAVMAIENSIAGSILANYNLLQSSNLSIIGEVYLEIQQHLLVNPGVKLSDIEEVHSHPMALLQCLDFLNQKNWKLVETEDTALSAKHIQQHNHKNIAGIAGQLAAEKFGLEILVPNIHTEKHNYTRFLILQRTDEVNFNASADKASINFTTHHEKGSLVKVLSVIAHAGINLSKLQSFPIPGSNFLYSFHADVEFDTIDQFNLMMKDIELVTNSSKIYGLYKNGQKQNHLKNMEATSMVNL